jgi:molybdate transport system substrate-binding protein
MASALKALNRIKAAGLTTLLFAFLLPLNSSAETLTIFAASSLKNALDEIVGVYQKESDDQLVVSYAGSSALARQIEMGAPADIFISANEAWMDYLQERKMILTESRFDLANNRLVLIGGQDQMPIALENPALQISSYLNESYLAMALTNAVPAGIYGKQALTSLGLWQDVESQVAQADNVRAALALVATGEAPIGIVYNSDAVAEPKVKILATFPANSHAPIKYPTAITDLGKQIPAEKFLKFLRSSATKAILERNGFSEATDTQ